MARKIHNAVVEVDGEERTVYYCKPSGALMLRFSDLYKDGKLSNEQSARQLFADCLRLNAEGAPMPQKQIDEIVADDYEFTSKLQALLMPRAPQGDAEKNG